MADTTGRTPRHRQIADPGMHEPGRRRFMLAAASALALPETIGRWTELSNRATFTEAMGTTPSIVLAPLFALTESAGSIRWRRLLHGSLRSSRSSSWRADGVSERRRRTEPLLNLPGSPAEAVGRRVIDGLLLTATEAQTMAYAHLKVHRADGIGWLEYHHPPRNAIHWEMLRELPVALEELLVAAEVRVIVIASALDRYFSTGADLTAFQGMTQEQVAGWVESCHSLVRQLRGAHKPLLAAIHGTAVGGGLEVVLHCDVRFAAHDARLGQPEVNIAFIPPVGATQALARLLGRSRALRLLYEGELLSASEALQIGLVDVVVPAEELRGRVRDYASALVRKPAATLAAIRRCVTAGLETSFDEGLEIERRAAVELGGHPNFAEGVNAFLAKRAPMWK